VVLELPDLQAINNPSEAKNLTILTVDLQMRATIPLLSYPKGATPNDGQGTDTADDPSGYLVAVRVDGMTAPVPEAPMPTRWTVGDGS
jgi:hypothetical protein